MNKLRFDSKHPDVWIALVASSYRTQWPYVAIRVDGRDVKTEGWRADMRTPLGPWEAIDGGRGFQTAGEAMRYAEEWWAASEEQLTLSPKMPPHTRVRWTDDPVAGTTRAEATFTRADFPDQFPNTNTGE